VSTFTRGIGKISFGEDLDFIKRRMK